jgi:nicotinic acid mononucleotide adenylyltransferase
LIGLTREAGREEVPAMEYDERMRRLHDRATRGGAISPEEQAELQAWYDEQDRGEAAILARSPESGSSAVLREQVRAGLQQVRTVSQRIERMIEENERLRREIEALQRRLAQAQPTPRA